MKLNGKNKIFIAIFLIITVSFFIGVLNENEKNAVQTTAGFITNTQKLSNKKIGWGIKRGQNNERPVIGNENKKLLDEFKGMYMGTAEKKYIYLTFDEGYEARIYR